MSYINNFWSYTFSTDTCELESRDGPLQWTLEETYNSKTISNVSQRNIWDLSPAVFSLYRTTFTFEMKSSCLTVFDRSVLTAMSPCCSQNRTNVSSGPVRLSRIPQSPSGASHGQPRCKTGICLVTCLNISFCIPEIWTHLKLKERMHINTNRNHSHFGVEG